MNNFFVKYKHPLSVIILLIVIGGVFSYAKMQTGLFPEITFPKIKIIVDAGQQPVEKMMITVTKPLENAIKQVQDLKLIRSTTSRGSCEISAFMDWDADIDMSKQRIESKINQIKNALPPNVSITVEKMNPSILPVTGYSLESETKSPIELRQLALYTIKPFLSQVDGVSEIRVIGGKTKEYWLELDFDKMAALQITPNDISQAMASTNFIQSTGYLTDYRMLYLTLLNAQVDKKDELENLIIKNDGKRIISLRDIATVEIKEAKEYIKVNANGKEGVLIAVLKQPNSNLVNMSEEMHKKVADLTSLLPKDVHLTPFYVQADFVNDTVSSVCDSLMIGLLLAIVVAVLFLRSFKASATILIIIPVTIALTIIILYAIGETFNIMTLGAIAAAIGLIIDDAIVVVEQIHRTHEEHPEVSTLKLLKKAIKYLFPAMLGSSLSTIVIFLPFVLMSGVAGAYFKVMTDTMIITLVCSFFVTWLLLPVVYLLLSKTHKKTKKQNSQKNSHHIKTQAWVGFFIKKPYLSIVFSSVLVLSIFLILPKLETGFLPEMDEGSIVLDYNSPPGTSLEETDRMLREVEKIIIQIPEIKAYSRRTGTQMGFFITEPNRGDYLIQLKKNRNRTTYEVIDEIRAKVEASQPALTIDFGQVIGDMLGDLMSSVQPIEVKIFGTDHQKIQEISRQVAKVVEEVPGTADVFDGITVAGPQINITPNFSRLAQYGITPADLQFQIQTSQEGNVVGSLFENEYTTDIRLVYPNSAKISVDDIRKLRVFLPGGKTVPITDLVDVELTKGQTEIERENLQTLGVVSGRLDNRDLGSVINQIQKDIALKINLPSGYRIEYAGAYQSQQQSFQELLIILITSSLLVFLIILFLFRDIRVALAILLISVLGISGSYLLLFFTNTPLNVGSYTGIIMIVGIIGENAIFTFLQFKNTLTETKNVDESIVYSISTRLRPKLMTALGAIIALIPLALGIGVGAELHQPLAIAVIGGFLVALPLLLIVLPSLLHLIFNPKI